MGTSTGGGRNDIQWTLRSQLDDLDFADDLALLSHSHAQIQDRTTCICLESTSAKIVLHVNNGKAKIARLQHASNIPVTVAAQAFEEVDSFTCLGSTVDTQGGREGVGRG